MLSCTHQKGINPGVFEWQIYMDFIENCYFNILDAERNVTECENCSLMKKKLLDAYDNVLSELALLAIKAFEKAYDQPYMGDTTTLLDAVKNHVESSNGDNPQGTEHPF